MNSSWINRPSNSDTFNTAFQCLFDPGQHVKVKNIFPSIERGANCVLKFLRRLKMSKKWIVIGSFVCFAVLLSWLFFVSLHQTRLRGDYANMSPEEKLSFSDIQVVVCGLEDT